MEPTGAGAVPGTLPKKTHLELQKAPTNESRKHSKISKTGWGGLFHHSKKTMNFQKLFFLSFLALQEVPDLR
jgi:hypothetical protein